MNLKDFLRLGGLPIFIASLCCITPIVLVLLGISSISFAVSLTSVLEGQYKWAFILAGAISLIFSLVIYFRKKGVCTIDQVIKERNGIINKTILVLIVTVVGYILFFEVFLGYTGRVLKIWD